MHGRVRVMVKEIYRPPMGAGGKRQPTARVSGANLFSRWQDETSRRRRLRGRGAAARALKGGGPSRPGLMTREARKSCCSVGEAVAAGGGGRARCMRQSGHACSPGSVGASIGEIATPPLREGLVLVRGGSAADFPGVPAPWQPSHCRVTTRPVRAGHGRNWVPIPVLRPR